MKYKFKNKVSQDMFDSHLVELKKRIKSSEFLNVEIEDSMFDQIKQKHIDEAERLLEMLNANEKINKKVEVFLLATHFMKMEEE